MALRSGLLKPTLLAASLLLSCLGPAPAAPIAIVNPSFEILPTTTPPGLPLPDGTRLTSRPDFCGTLNPAGFPCEGFGPGWIPAAIITTDSVGTMNPTDAMFNGPLPDGEYTAYSNGTSFFQILTETLQPNFIYTLSAYVGMRNLIPNDPMLDGYTENQGYYVELSVDNNGTYDGRTVLARSSWLRLCCPGIPPSFNAPDSGSPGYGNWIQVSFTYTPGVGAPIGKNLMIGFGSPGVSANFDMVSLNAEPTIPEPSTVTMLAGGLGLFLIRRYRSRA